jgi:predicted thioesterase
MVDVPVGTRGEQRVLVTHEYAIDFLGVEQARVLATPWMIALMEWTCRNSVLPLLPEGWDTVGTSVNVRHLAATPVGMSIVIRSEVIGVEDRRIQFRLEAFDEKEKIGEGTHERVAIDVARFAAKLAQKRAGAA